jgi:hypothetical protein
MTIQIVITILIFASVLVVIWQLFLLNRQRKDDHERSRRETVLNLQKLWLQYCGNSKPRIIRNLLRAMNEEVCAKIWREEPFTLSGEWDVLLSQLFDNKREDIRKNERGEIIFGKNELLLLRTHLVNYLNLLEVIFTAWVNNVGDRDMIETEFGKNISRDNHNFPLDVIVNLGPAFPSIRKFSLHIKSKEDPKIITKKKL